MNVAKGDGKNSKGGKGSGTNAKGGKPKGSSKGTDAGKGKGAYDPKQIGCKYHVNGSCHRGADCLFSHK